MGSPSRLAVSPEANADSIVELPAHWSLDDWEPYNYLPGITGSGVIASPADVIARWTLELEALVEQGGLYAQLWQRQSGGFLLEDGPADAANDALAKGQAAE